MKIYIYLIYFPTSNRLNPYYVGQTAYLNRRMLEHLRNKNNNFVGNALQKYDDWTIEILHTAKDRDEANRIEIEKIRHYDCIAPNGYNLTRGGDGVDGFKHSDEFKENQRNFMNGNQYGKGKNLGNKNGKGHHHTEEWKQNKSKEMQGNQYTRGKNWRLKRNVKVIKTQ